MINTITTATTRMPSEEPGMETGVGVGTITSVAGMGVRVMPGNAEAGTLKAALIIASAIPRLSSRIKRKAFGGIFMVVSDFLNAPEYITQSWLVLEGKRADLLQDAGGRFAGGEGGIRTREPLRVTRAPGVRARPNYATSPCCP